MHDNPIHKSPLAQQMAMKQAIQCIPQIILSLADLSDLQVALTF